MLRAQLRESLKESQLARDALRVSTLRMVISALKERDRVRVAEQGEAELSDAEIMQMLQTMIKQRGESVKAYAAGGREDLAAKERAEIDLLQGFLPQPLADSELEQAIDALLQDLRSQKMDLGKSAMGQVMAALKAQYPGRIDMSHAASVLRSRL